MRPAPGGPAHRAPCARRRRLRGPAPRRPGAPAPQHSAWSPAGTTGAGAAAAGAVPGPQCPRHGAVGCRPLQRAAARSPRRTTAVRAGPDGPGRGPRRGGGEAAAPGPSRPPNKAGDERRAVGGATWRARSAAARPAGRPPPVPGSACRAGADPCSLKGPVAPAFGGHQRHGGRGAGTCGPRTFSDSQVVFLFKDRPAPRSLSGAFPRVTRDSADVGLSGTQSLSCVALLETGTLPFTVALRGGGERRAQPTSWGSPLPSPTSRKS